MRLLTTPMTLADIEVMAKSGADGLIFGNAAVSLRHAAAFRYACWTEMIKRCHDCGVEALFLMNRLFDESELPMMKETMEHLLELGIDGIYFADEALLAHAQKLHQEHRLIYQPDTLLTNHLDVNYYLAEGCKQVVLAKEITLDEILQIAKQCDAERLELIGHGRVVMMHSRRPLLSNYMQFLHQDVSLKYKQDLYLIEDTRTDRMPILEDDAGTHIFSGYVQCSFQEMEAFMNAGIGAMRIDGIFHSSETIVKTLFLYDQLRKGDIGNTEAEQAYRLLCGDEPIKSGFYYQATSTTK